MTKQTAEAVEARGTKFQEGDYVKILPFNGRKLNKGEEDLPECSYTDSEGHTNTWPVFFDDYVGQTFQVVREAEKTGYFVFPGAPDGITEEQAGFAAMLGAPFLGLIADWIEPSTKEAFDETYNSYYAAEEDEGDE